MNRKTKNLKRLSAVLLLLNLPAIFFPVTVRTQAHYADLRISLFDYLLAFIRKSSDPYAVYSAQWDFADYYSAASYMKGGNAKAYAIVCGLLILLTVIAALLIFFHKKYNIVLVISALAPLAAAIVLKIFCVKGSWLPKSTNGAEWIYKSGMGENLPLIFSGICFLLLFMTMLLDREPKKSVAVNKNAEEKKAKAQEVVQPKYNVNMEANPQGERTLSLQAKIRENMKLHQPGKARGVLVGITGIYEGAEIPVQDGETIRLGRSTDNDLIFSNQTFISRKHCKITWNRKEARYTFHDYSSEGSFIFDSEDMLPQNLDVYVAPGTVIALGDLSNTFRLE